MKRDLILLILYAVCALCFTVSVINMVKTGNFNQSSTTYVILMIFFIAITIVYIKKVFFKK